MKRLLCIILAVIMCLSVMSCGREHTAAEDNDLPTIRDPDGTSTMPADKALILRDQTVKHTDFTVDEKLEILNDLKNKEFVSAFLVIDHEGWCSVTVGEEKEPEAFQEIVNFFASPDVEYEVFRWDLSELTDYVAYVTLTDKEGNKYTLFVQDYNIIHYDEQTGTFSNGNPMYNYTESAAVCFDGDWFVIRDTLVWWPLTQIDVKYTGHYY